MPKNNKDNGIDQIDKFHKTRKGRIAFGLIEFLVAYIFISLAINSGSLWQYVVAIILAVGATNNLVRGVKTNGDKPAKKV